MTETVVPIRELADEEALAWLRAQGGTSLTHTALAQRWGWPRYKVSRRLQSWEKSGRVTRSGDTLMVQDGAPVEQAIAPGHQTRPKPVRTLVHQPLHNVDCAQELLGAVNAPTRAPIAAPLTVTDIVGAAGADQWNAASAHRPGGLDGLAIAASIALACTSAWFSVRGFAVLFPGAPIGAATLAGTLEASKLVCSAWLARHWLDVPYIWRGLLILLLTGLVAVNMSGLFANLVAAHIGDREKAMGMVGINEATLDARIEAQRHVVADLDKRVSQIDSAIDAASARGRTVTALNAIQDQRKARTGLQDERKREAGALVAMQSEHASLASQAHQIDVGNAPVRFLAETFHADNEQAVRWLIALVVVCTDMLSMSIAAAVSARRRNSHEIPA